jgi:hypothetical protein
LASISTSNLEKKKNLTTPNKAQIEQYARELYVQDCYKHGNPELADINPELNELRESGFISVAISELMSDTATRQTEQYTDYIQAVENFNKKFSFDIEAALTNGVTICGNRGTGKTSLAKTIVRELQRQAVNVKIFDNSQAWLSSSIETIIEVTPNSQVASFDSAIYDLSRLTPQEQRSFIEKQVKTDYYEAVKTPQTQRESTVFVFEECEIILGKNYTPIMQQLVSVGRNFKLSYVAIAQRLARIGTDLISLSGQLYIGKLHEQNDLAKIRNWVSDTQALKDLNLGDFIRYSNGKTELIHCDKFEDNTEHTYIKTPTIPAAPQPQSVDWAPLAKLAVISLLAALFIIGAVI